VLSVIIPSYKDPLLHRTIEDLLDQAQGSIEIVPVIDGYTLQAPLPDDPRVRPLILEQNVGMREAINRGVAASVGDCLLRADEHQRFSKGYDVALTASCEHNWIVTPRRYALDPVQWAIMDEIPPVDYMKLKVVSYGRGHKFSGVNWDRPDRESRQIDETMAMQGSCWVMRRAWWNAVIVRLQSDGYGTHYQDSHEMVFKTWQAGGKLMVNKGAWHAHKHRKFPRTHGYGGALADASFAYALQVWRDYYDTVVRPAWGV